MNGFRDAIARITIDGVPGRGTGFLVSDDLVAPALHVVGDRKTDPPTKIPGTIRLEFPGHKTEAVVLDDRWNLAADCVLLKCVRPFECTPIPLRDVHSSDTAWKAFGFPDTQPLDGMTFTGTVTDSVAKLLKHDVIQLYSLEGAASNGAPIPGMSGAPVLVGNAAVGLMRVTL